MKTLFAQLISRFFGPEAALPLYLIVALQLSGAFTPPQTVTLVPALIFLDWLIPLLSIVILIKLGKISDIDISRRRQRPLVLLIIIAGYALAALLSFILGNGLVFRLHLVLAALITFLTVITLRYKVSFHTSGNTVLFLFLNYLYGWRLGWVFSLLIPIAWSRYYLKKHTLAQLGWGIAVALFVGLTGLNILV